MLIPELVSMVAPLNLHYQINCNFFVIINSIRLFFHHTYHNDQFSLRWLLLCLLFCIKNQFSCATSVQSVHMVVYILCESVSLSVSVCVAFFCHFPFVQFFQWNLRQAFPLFRWAILNKRAHMSCCSNGNKSDFETIVIFVMLLPFSHCLSLIQFRTQKS